jgi:integrase
MTLGKYPVMTIQAARQRAIELISQIGRGTDPRATSAASAGTVEHLFREYLEHHAKPHCKTWKEMEGYFRNYFGPIKGLPLLALSKAQVQHWHAEIGRLHGPRAANHAITLLSAMFNKGIDWDLVEHNPASRVKKFKRNQRERFLLPAEIPVFLKAVESLDESGAFYLLCLYTGARKTNVASMRWQDIDMDRYVWCIPDTKNGQPQFVPLIPSAVSILESRQLNNHTAWVFPSSKSSTGYRTRFQVSWGKLRESTNLRDLNIHDLRRTLASWEAMTGANISVISKTMGHRHLASTQIYARLDLASVRTAMEAAIAAILQCNNSPQTV